MSTDPVRAKTCTFGLKPSRELRVTRTSNRTMDEAQNSGKILSGTEGIGTVTPQMIEKRAREIARGDGRAQPNDLDRARAREELTGVALARRSPRRTRNLVATGECHLWPPARKLRRSDLKMTK